MLFWCCALLLCGVFVGDGLLRHFRIDIISPVRICVCIIPLRLEFEVVQQLLLPSGYRRLAGEIF